MKEHFDGWGHRISNYFDMIKRYSYDRGSIEVLRRFAPFRYVVMPDVEIHVKRDPLVPSYVQLTWPCEIRKVIYNESFRVRAALRRLFVEGRYAWRAEVTSGEVVFYRRGKIVENIKTREYTFDHQEGR